MPDHNQIQVKVNALVDEGIADLVTALATVPDLITLESCQGGEGADAFVHFRLGGWQEAGRFLFEELAPKLPTDLRADIAMRLEAYGTSGTALGTLTMNPRAVSALADIIRRSEGATVSPRPLVAWVGT